MSYKQVVLVRADLKLPKGKIAAQASHACVDAVLKALKKDPEKVEDWRYEGMKKIILKVDSEKELVRFFQEAKDRGLTAALITDAGKTVVLPGTKTCIAIGPDSEERIDDLTGKLKMV
jgi:peptidyl-tRNA hydrolase, PTH2 family